MPISVQLVIGLSCRWFNSIRPSSSLTFFFLNALPISRLLQFFFCDMLSRKVAQIDSVKRHVKAKLAEITTPFVAIISWRDCMPVSSYGIIWFLQIETKKTQLFTLIKNLYITDSLLRNKNSSVSVPVFPHVRSKVESFLLTGDKV